MHHHHDPGAFVRTPEDWLNFDFREPQTALSELAWTPAFSDIPQVASLDDLDLARLRHMRRQAADCVDHMIALLDAIDARFTDMEPDDGDDEDGQDDELSLGWTAEVSQTCLGGGSDDAEPSLGAPENHDEAPDQRRWAEGDGPIGEGERGEDESDRGDYLTTSARDANSAAARQAREKLRAIVFRKRGQGRTRDFDELAIPPGQTGSVRYAVVGGTELWPA